LTLSGPTGPTSQATVPVTVTFSEPVVGFDLTDLTLVNWHGDEPDGGGGQLTRST